MTYLGHVKNGVIVLDAPATLGEGTPVRVESLAGARIDAEKQHRGEHYRALLQRLQEWNREDADEEGRLGDVLQTELAADRGIRFGDGSELEKILTQP